MRALSSSRLAPMSFSRFLMSRFSFSILHAPSTTLSGKECRACTLKASALVTL